MRIEEELTFYTPPIGGVESLLGEATDWSRDAACASVEDPDIFFPERGGSAVAARRICSGCPVKQECLEMGLSQLGEYGVWGGLSRMQRRALG